MLTIVFRVLIAGFLAMSGLVLATSAPAFACKCAAQDLAQQVEDADVVFTGVVNGSTEVGQDFEYAITANRAYKGTVDYTTSVITPQDTAACGLGELEVDTEYLFLVTGDAPPYAATSCGGSGPANTDRLDKIEKALGAGTAVDAPPPPPPTMTKVEESAPASVSRLAAPGGALVIVGFLGLLVVGRLARK